MKQTKIMIALIAGVLFTPTLFAQTTNITSGTKASAQLSASCQFTAQSVSFGNLILPITAQQSTSKVQVLCTRGTPYSIVMGAYSNIYVKVRNGYGVGAYDSNTGQQVSIPANWQTTYTKTETMPSGPDCASIYGCDIYKLGGVGTMKGASKGDTVSYKIKNPGDNSKNWDGTTAYNSIGSGVMQNIPLLAEIVPANTTAFPAPDMYTDSVTTTLTF